MSVLVTFHAHPDDEAIACGGVMAKAAAAGHRVVLVSATRGEHGEVPDGFLEPGETLAERREQELQAAAGVLGASRVEFLGYVDSGMMGVPANEAPDSFWLADVEEAAARLAALLQDERADVMTIYDEGGTYGHPDHIKVHHVGVRAAEIASTPVVYESVVPVESLERGFARLKEAGIDPPFDPGEFGLGVPEATVTTFVDVSGYVGAKRAAMRAHASQIPEESFFLSLPEEWFKEAFGLECFRLRGAEPGLRETELRGLKRPS